MAEDKEFVGDGRIDNYTGLLRLLTKAASEKEPFTVNGVRFVVQPSIPDDTPLTAVGYRLLLTVLDAAWRGDAAATEASAHTAAAVPMGDAVGAYALALEAAAALGEMVALRQADRG